MASRFLTEADKNELAKRIPTKTSQLTNDSGYVTDDAIPTKTSQLTNDSKYQNEDQVKASITEALKDVNVDADLSDYALKEDIPTKTSQLTNDSGFLTKHQDLSSYALKNDVADNLAAAKKYTDDGIDNLSKDLVFIDTEDNEDVNDPYDGSTIVVDSELSLESENPVQNKVVTEEVNRLSEEIDDLKSEDISFWHENICPNIYLVTNGTVQANGTLRDYNNTINVLKKLGVKKVSILCAIDSYENNRFYLQTNVDYSDVVYKVHEAGMKVESVRFSNSLYGKENMRDETKLADLATSIPLILNEIGIADEVEFVGILNETSVVYFDEAYTNAVVGCIQALQNSGYKVAITDNMRFVLRIPEAILNVLDYVGFNEYPLLSAFEELATEFSVAESFEYTQAVMYIDKLKQKGLKVYYSEIGCANQTNALGTPVEGSIGDYNGMTNILLEFKGFKKYLSDSKLNQLIESYNPWFTDVWEATDEMIELFWGE